MAYNEGLAQRVRVVLEGKSGLEEKKMFGGVCFLLRGNMACGILNESLIVRVGPKKYENALKLPTYQEIRHYRKTNERLGNGLS